MTSEGENTNTRYDLTEDEELIVHELATTQLVDERPKMRSFQENLKRGQFEYWEELYIELDGKCDTLKDLQCNFKNNIDVHDVTKLCVPIIHEIKKLPEGKTRVFEYYIERDNMKCTHLTVASIFNNITQGSYIRKQCKPDSKGHMKVLIYRYNSETQLWDNTTDLKTHFIHTMKLYCALLCQKRVNDIPLNKDTFEENYTEKDKDEKGIYLKRQKMYCNLMECNSHINAIIDIFKSLVTVEDTLLDLAPEYDKYICFRNGIYNLDTSEFRRRDISDRFTESLDWDYGKHYNYACYGVISEFFTKLQPDLEQRTFTVSFLKYCLRGGNPQAMFKMNIGYTARNGKTSEMKIFQTAFPMYTETLHKSIFNVGCPKFHKYAYKFVSADEIDETKHWYLVDPTWVKTRLSQDSYKLAFFHFLLNEGITPVKTPKANICLVKEQLEENDEFIPKLEQYFKVTGDHNDRIAALELRKYFCGEHNDKMSVLTLNGHFKRLTAKLGIKYDKDGSVNSTRKVYRGLRKYTESERFEMEGGENPE